MIINNTYGFQFYAEVHTGSRAVSAMLMEIPGSKEVGHHHMTREYGLERNLVHAGGCFSFRVIRDPRETIATKIALFLNAQDRAVESSRPALTEKAVIARHVKWACEGEEFFRHNDCDCTIKYPSLENDLNNLLKWLGVKDIPVLPKIGVTPNKKQWFKYFTHEQMLRMYRDIPEIREWR